MGGVSIASSLELVAQTERGDTEREYIAPRESEDALLVHVTRSSFYLIDREHTPDNMQRREVRPVCVRCM